MLQIELTELRKILIVIITVYANYWNSCFLYTSLHCTKYYKKHEYICPVFHGVRSSALNCVCLKFKM